MLYTQYDAMKLALNPLSHYLQRSLATIEVWDKVFPQFAFLNNFTQAKYALTNNLIKDYPKLPWAIKPVDGQEVQETVVEVKDFCELRLFSINTDKDRPALFMVAPLSGHYATLLRDTVQTFVKDFNVYVTDWLNPRDIPASVGEFGFEDYVNYVIDFSKNIRKKYGYVKALAVCQPTIPVVAANAYLAKTQPEYQFEEVILMGGPLDTRLSPTQVNEYAMRYPIQWFKSNVIKSVPFWYKGNGRQVYPGFLQHFGFLSMNMKRHAQAHIDFFNHLIEGADLDAKKHQDFYDEYNAVMDLPAKYYLETLENVFMDQKLAKGTLMINGVSVAMSDINKGNYILLEGELDDISGLGQTHAAYDLMVDIQNKKKVIAKDVGHYGIFSGSGFRNNIYPVLKDFLNTGTINTNQRVSLSGENVFSISKKLDSSKQNNELKETSKVSNDVTHQNMTEISEVVVPQDMTEISNGSEVSEVIVPKNATEINDGSEISESSITLETSENAKKKVIRNGLVQMEKATNANSTVKKASNNKRSPAKKVVVKKDSKK